jgi:hypothetical protein
MTKAEIKAMMKSAGLDDVRYAVPFWCAVGRKI